MNVLLLDSMEMFLDFALRCTRAGHYVRLCVARDKKTGKRSTIGDGMVEKIENEEWQKHMDWADLIVLSDNTKWLPELDVKRRQGYPIFGPSVEAANLELSRGKGQELLKKNGIKVIPYEMFSDYRKAEEYVLKTNKAFACKPDGDKDKALSYVSKSAKDMVFMLRRWADMNKGKNDKFMLQEKVDGVEFAVAGWLGSKGFSRFFEENFEHKKLMNEDYGPNTGEMGTCCKYVENSTLAQEVLLPLESDLIRMGCSGSVDVSVIVDERGDPRPLEFTCRLGWPSFNIVQSLHPEPCEWMLNLLDGKDTFEPLSQVATGVLIAMPPFPHPDNDDKKVTGIPIWGLNGENEYYSQISPCSVMSGMAPNDDLEDERTLVSCGDYLAICTGIGDTVREASRDAYKAVKSVEIPNDIIVRTDIGDIEKDLTKLQDNGFAKDWNY
jgi:phosphoribosylamine--glycine ligase